MIDILRTLDRGYTLIWREGRLEDALGALEVEWKLRQGAPDRALAIIDRRGRGSGVPTEMRFDPQ